eukprot:2208917-Pyramimonas_sp.AAC.1
MAWTSRRNSMRFGADPEGQVKISLTVLAHPTASRVYDLPRSASACATREHYLPKHCLRCLVACASQAKGMQLESASLLRLTTAKLIVGKR